QGGPGRIERERRGVRPLEVVAAVLLQIVDRLGIAVDARRRPIAGEAVSRLEPRVDKSRPPPYARSGTHRSAAGSRRPVAVIITPIDDWFANSRRARATV